MQVATSHKSNRWVAVMMVEGKKQRSSPCIRYFACLRVHSHARVSSRIILRHVEREMLYFVPRYLETPGSARPCQSDAGIRNQTGGTVSQHCNTGWPTPGFYQFEPPPCACIPRQPVYTAPITVSKRSLGDDCLIETGGLDGAVQSIEPCSFGKIETVKLRWWWGATLDLP